MSWIYGKINPQLVCPHCQTKGMVHSQLVKTKKGWSPGKVVGAIFTAGLSAGVTGLSRKEQETMCHCDSCNSTWCF